VSSRLPDELRLTLLSTVERLKTVSSGKSRLTLLLLDHQHVRPSARPTPTSRNFSLSLVLFHLGDVLPCRSLLALVFLLYSLCVFGFLHSSCSQKHCHFLKANGRRRGGKKKEFSIYSSGDKKIKTEGFSLHMQRNKR